MWKRLCIWRVLQLPLATADLGVPADQQPMLWPDLPQAGSWVSRLPQGVFIKNLKHPTTLWCSSSESRALAGRWVLGRL